MKVYVLWLVDRYGSDCFEGVYSTPEDAQAAARAYKHTWGVGRHFVIYEATLDESRYGIQGGKRVYEAYEVAHHADG